MFIKHAIREEKRIFDTSIPSSISSPTAQTSIDTSNSNFLSLSLPFQLRPNINDRCTGIPCSLPSMHHPLLHVNRDTKKYQIPKRERERETYDRQIEGERGIMENDREARTGRRGCESFLPRNTTRRP